MTEPDFKPSDVNLSATFPPLVGTMGRTEAEIAAAMLVRACHEHGDVWQDVSPVTVARVVLSDIEAKREPFYGMNRNPFCKPDVQDLVRRGRAEWIGEPGLVVRFTSHGFDGLSKFVKRPDATQSTTTPEEP